MCVNFKSVVGNNFNILRNRINNSKISFKGLQEDTFERNIEQSSIHSKEDIKQEIADLKAEYASFEDELVSLRRRSSSYKLQKKNADRYGELRQRAEEIKKKIAYLENIYLNPNLEQYIGCNTNNLPPHVLPLEQIVKDTGLSGRLQGTMKRSNWGKEAFGAIATERDAYGDWKRDYIVDRYIPTYIANIDTLKSLQGKEVYSKQSFERKLLEDYDISDKTTRRLTSAGMLEPIKLLSPEGGLINTTIFDKNSETNSKGIEIYTSIMPRKIGPEQGKTSASLRELINFGYDNPQEIYRNMKLDNIKGTVENVKTPQGIKKKITVDLTDAKTRFTLDGIRKNSARFLNIMDFAKEHSMSPSDVIMSIYNQELEAVKGYFGFDNSVIIDTENPKNAEFIAQISAQEETAASLDRRSATSIRGKLMWRFSPNCKRIQATLIAKTPEMKGILDRRDRIRVIKSEIYELKTKLYDKENNISAEEKDELYSKIDELLKELNEIRLTKDEIIKMKQFYKTFWQIANKDEINIATKRASEIIRQYKIGGLAAIEDEEIKAIFQAHQG